MSDRRAVTEGVEVLSYSEGNGDEEIDVGLSLLIERLTAIRETVPADCRDTAVLHFSASGDYAHGYVNVRYVRQETDAEMLARQRCDEQYEAAREARERANFERLRAKYET